MLFATGLLPWPLLDCYYILGIFFPPLALLPKTIPSSFLPSGMWSWGSCKRLYNMWVGGLFRRRTARMYLEGQNSILCLNSLRSMRSFSHRLLLFSVFATDMHASNNTLFLHIRNGNTSSAGIFHLIVCAFLPGASAHQHCNAVFLSTAVWHFAVCTISRIQSLQIFKNTSPLAQRT